MAWPSGSTVAERRRRRRPPGSTSAVSGARHAAHLGKNGDLAVFSLFCKQSSNTWQQPTPMFWGYLSRSMCRNPSCFERGTCDHMLEKGLLKQFLEPNRPVLVSSSTQTSGYPWVMFELPISQTPTDATTKRLFEQNHQNQKYPSEFYTPCDIHVGSGKSTTRLVIIRKRSSEVPCDPFDSVLKRLFWTNHSQPPSHKLHMHICVSLQNVSGSNRHPCCVCIRLDFRHSPSGLGLGHRGQSTPSQPSADLKDPLGTPSPSTTSSCSACRVHRHAGAAHRGVENHRRAGPL